MTILTALLRQCASIEPYEGESATEPLFGAPVTYPARIEPKHRWLTTATGEAVVSDAILYLRPDAAVAAGDRVTVNEVVYRVLSIAELGGLTCGEYIEATLGRSET